MRTLILTVSTSYGAVWRSGWMCENSVGISLPFILFQKPR